MDEQTCNQIFSDFVVLESGYRCLNEYVSNLNIENKEILKRLAMIKELAKQKLKSSVIDDANIGALIKETNDFYNKKNKQLVPQAKSFKDLIYDDIESGDQEMIKSNYLYNSAIIYVDSIKDMANLSNTNSILSSFLVYEDSKSNTNTCHIFSNAIDKPKIFRNHYNLLRHFVLLNPDFKTKFQSNCEGLEILGLNSLQGNSNEVCVLGMLLCNEEGKIQIQDPSKVVNVDISECTWGKGFFTQGCIVLLQGTFKNDLMKAKLILHPPPAFNNRTYNEKYENDFFGAVTKAFKTTDDTRTTSINFSNQTNFSKNITMNNASNLHNINVNNINNPNNKPEEKFLLGFLHKDTTSSKTLFPKNIESHIQMNIESMSKSNFNSTMTERIFQANNDLLSEEFFIVISNPDLTNQNVLNAIDKIITGYGSVVDNNTTSIPFMIIFIGNFTSEASFSSFKIYQQCFDDLANIISKNSLIVKNTYIVFIPGPDEFSLFSGFPKHPVIDTVINPLKKKIPHIISATNPCRFSIFGKEIVIFRDNLNKKLSRNSITKSEDPNKFKDDYVYTILSQGNLAPVDLSVTPRIWHLAHSMLILPLPDILILADVVEDFIIDNGKTNVANPGNFSKDYSFNIVYPLKKTVEPCKINLI